jgi:murein DD-endopeptidase MepM/ murein hydrolase activator NlpD
VLVDLANQDGATNAQIQGAYPRLTALRTELSQTESQIEAIKSKLRLQAVNAYVDGGRASAPASVLNLSDNSYLRTGYVNVVMGDEQHMISQLAQAQSALRREENSLADVALRSGGAIAASALGQDPVSPVQYVNPLAVITNLKPERVDQGVDYVGAGPLQALGSGIIRLTSEAGWPGGTFLALQLEDGPLAGRIVYYAENVTPTVRVGQHVNAGDMVGVLHDAYPNLEIGWGGGGTGGGTLGNALARSNGGSGSNAEGVSTAAGVAFNQLLMSLGAPGGIQQGTVGHLPPAFG